MASFKVDITHMTSCLPGPSAQLGILPVSLERASYVLLDFEQTAMAYGTSTVSDHSKVNFWASCIIRMVTAMAHEHADHPVAWRRMPLAFANFQEAVSSPQRLLVAFCAHIMKRV